MAGIFESVWGQKNSLTVLEKNLVDDKVASAYLFSGVDGTGKIKTALLFAQALLCKDNGGEQCSCNSCSMFLSGSHPDFMAIVPTEAKSKLKDGELTDILRDPSKIGLAGKSDTIKIEQARNIISGLSLKSYFGGRKVCIVESVESMNRQTANAFLKTLEEPPPETVIILTSGSASSLLPTIVSRCRVVRFVPMEPSSLAEKLVCASGVSEDEALRLALLAEGRPGIALDDGIEHARELDNEALEIISRLPRMGVEDVISMAESWKKRREDIPMLFHRMMEIMRLASRPNSTPVSDTMARTFDLLSVYPAQRLVDGYFTLLDKMPSLVFNPNVQLLLESTIFNLQSIILKGESLGD